MNPLDYELIWNDREWQVWTIALQRGEAVACIGSGAAKTTALLDAIDHMACTIHKMHSDVTSLLESAGNPT